MAFPGNGGIPIVLAWEDLKAAEIGNINARQLLDDWPRF